MCIIIYKPAGVKAPSKRTLKKLWRDNPDGGGLMYVDRSADAVAIEKGFVTFGDFWRFYQTVRDTDAPLAIHFRIATHGGISPYMTQPFPLTSSADDVRALSISADVGVAHNGIIGLTAYATKESDTALFIREYLHPIWNSDIPRGVVLDIVEQAIDGSRLLIMERGGAVHLLGKWHSDGGLFYSNDGYKDKPRKAWTRGALSPYSWDYHTCNYDCSNCSNEFNCYGWSDTKNNNISDDDGKINVYGISL